MSETIRLKYITPGLVYTIDPQLIDYQYGEHKREHSNGWTICTDYTKPYELCMLKYAKHPQYGFIVFNGRNRLTVKHKSTYRRFCQDFKKHWPLIVNIREEEDNCVP